MGIGVRAVTLAVDVKAGIAVARVVPLSPVIDANVTVVVPPGLPRIGDAAGVVGGEAAELADSESVSVGVAGV